MTSSSQLNSIEQKFLCQVLRSFVDETPLPAIPNSIGWDRLHWVLSVNRILPVFHHTIGREKLLECDAPTTLVDLWNQRSRGVARRNRRIPPAAVEMSNFLAEAGILCVVTRGISLLYRAYGDEGLRPMSDIDMLVPRNQAGSVVSRFSSAGRYPFTKSKNQVVCEVGGCQIEIHWHIIKRKFSGSIDFSELLAEPETLSTEWGELKVLSPENELIGVISHHFLHHDMDRLQKVVDVALLCARFDLDWEYVRDWAERAQLLTMFQFTLSLVDHLLETNFHTLLRTPSPRHFDSKTFAPYMSRLFGRDTRRTRARRLATSVAIVDGADYKVRMVLRFARKKDIQKLLARPYDSRKAPRPQEAGISNADGAPPVS